MSNYYSNFENSSPFQECIENLKRRFTSSARVQRLVGMRYEAEGKLNEAQKVYDTILQEDESNVVGGSSSRFV